MKFDFMSQPNQPSLYKVSPESIQPQYISPGSIQPQPIVRPFPPYQPYPPYPQYPLYPTYPYPGLPINVGGCQQKWARARLRDGRTINIYVTSISEKSIGGFLPNGRQIALDLDEIVEMTC